MSAIGLDTGHALHPSATAIPGRSRQPDRRGGFLPSPTAAPRDPRTRKARQSGLPSSAQVVPSVEVESVIDLFAYDAGNEVTKFFHDASVGDEDGKCPWLRWIWLL